MLLIVAKPALHDFQVNTLGGEPRYILFFIVRRVENESKEPTPQNVVSTFDVPGLLVSVRKRATQDQPQHPMEKFPSEVCNHLRSGVHLVVFPVKLLNRVWELFKSDQEQVANHIPVTAYRGDVRNVMRRERRWL